jgi:hypothetical protein
VAPADRGAESISRYHRIDPIVTSKKTGIGNRYGQ